MAIGPDGKVTTTGLMDSGMKTPDAPDMSKLKAPAQPKQKTAPAAAMVKRPEPKDPAIVEKLNTLSEEEKIQLDMVLSPSLATILKKISPDLRISARFDVNMAPFWPTSSYVVSLMLRN